MKRPVTRSISRLLLNRADLLVISILLLVSCSQPEPNGVCCGQLLDLDFFGEKNRVQVWLPDGYSEAYKYPVIYMHDGQMLFDGTNTWNGQEWKVDETITRLIEENRIEPCIVVAIWNSGAGRRDEYLPQKPFDLLDKQLRDSIIEYSKTPDGRPCFESSVRSDDYLKYLVDLVKPAVDKRFSTKSDKDNTFIIGSSMGGLISLYALCEYREVFGGAACMSTHWLGIHDYDRAVLADTMITWFAKNIPDLNTHKLYFDHGTETLDKYYQEFQSRLDSMVKTDSPNYQSRIFKGDSHTEEDWSKRFNEPLEFLLR